MSALQALFLLPAALLLDLLFSEPPARVHPVCGMGYLASRAEPFFRRLLSCPFPPDTEGGSPLREGLAGLLAGLAVILPPAVIAWSLTALAGYSGTAGGFAMAAVSVWLCLAPVSLARHALRVRDAAEAGKTGEARKAVSMIVGRDTSLLDMHGVCRACVESVAENLTDGVLCTLFWAMAGGLIAGFPGETEEEFHDTLEVMGNMKAIEPFMYYYNPREGTRATKMKGQIDDDTKHRRLSELIAFETEIVRKEHEKRIGQETEVLLTQISKQDGNEMLGHTEHDEMVVVKTCAPVGSLLNVKLTGIKGNTFEGTLVGEEKVDG